MQIQIVSVGNKMPLWVQQGYQEYARRLPRECQLQLQEVVAGKRGKNSDLARIVRDEGERIIAAVAPDTQIVALEVKGKAWSTPDLATALQRWLEGGRNVALLIGGPEGLSQKARDHAHEFWSLSNLTFPHPLVRVIVAEQIYRAWSLLHNHPYHR